MEYILFIKYSLLKQNIGTFTDNLGNADIKKIESTVVDNLRWGKLKDALKEEDNRKIMVSIFNEIDGRTLNKEDLRNKKTTVPLKKRDGIIEKAEIYQLVKDYYQYEERIKLSDEDVSKMKMPKLLDIFVKMYEIISSYQKNSKN